MTFDRQNFAIVAAEATVYYHTVEGGAYIEYRPATNDFWWRAQPTPGNVVVMRATPYFVGKTEKQILKYFADETNFQSNGVWERVVLIICEALEFAENQEDDSGE